MRWISIHSFAGVLAVTLIGSWIDSTTAEPISETPLTVAVLDFAASDPANPNLGQEVAAALTAMLSDAQGIRLVDRQSLHQTMEEQELNLTGLVSDAQAIKIGKLVGARIIVSGRMFRLGNDLYVTAKLVGTETGLVEGVMVKDAASADTGAMVVQLSDKLAAKLRQAGPKLVAQPEAAVDPFPALRDKLAKRQLPVVAVVVREQHHASPAARQPIDPAVETEIKQLLVEAGFTVLDVPQNELTGFTRDWTAANVAGWPQTVGKVEVLIAGEAFSEFASRIGNLVSCSARAELNLVRRPDARVLLVDRVTTRATDLSENIAGKKALQSAGRTAGIRILEHFAETLPATEDK